MLKIGIAAAGAVIAIIICAAAAISIVGTSNNVASLPSDTALADIPADYLALYQQAATVCPGLDWTVLAAVGKIETNHGRSTAPGVHSGQNWTGAGGPMQFLADTFTTVTARHHMPPGGANPPSRYNPHDAVYAAAYQLCDNGAARGDVHAAIYAYNHANWYVDAVLGQARHYRQTTIGIGGCTTIHTVSPVALVASNYACRQLGLPYTWGGNGPQHGDAGFDCSGLTQAAYATAGITLPRTADAQYRTSPHIPTNQPLQPGDLVFYGTNQHVHHVGLYIGQDIMINAPDFGQVIKTEPYQAKDYLGATRPAATVKSDRTQPFRRSTRGR